MKLWVCAVYDDDDDDRKKTTSDTAAISHARSTYRKKLGITARQIGSHEWICATALV